MSSCGRNKHCELDSGKSIGFFSPCLTDKRQPNAPPALCRTPRVEVSQLMTGTRQTVAVVMTFRKSKKHSIPQGRHLSAKYETTTLYYGMYLHTLKYMPYEKVFQINSVDFN
jgi:hypothetical protein